jgi:hypothetical protein
MISRREAMWAAADEVTNLFAPEDQFLMVTEENFVHGCEGVVGLRLVACCVYDELYRGEEGAEPHLASATPGEPDPSALQRLARVRRAVAELERSAPGWFVLGYHIFRTAEWHLACSPGLSRAEAAAELLGFVRSSMSLEEPDVCH